MIRHTSIALWQAAQHGWKRAVQIARLSCGIPDYDVYVRHLQNHHPGHEIPSYEAFFRERQATRYKGGGGRCC